MVCGTCTGLGTYFLGPGRIRVSGDIAIGVIL